MNTTLHSPTNSSVSRLRQADTLLLIVDVQERLSPAIHDTERVEKNCIVLARAAVQLQIPILVTEQNPTRLGGTLASIVEVLGENTPISKMHFTACVPDSLEAIERSGRRTILICGVESHVCVLQTTLDLLEAGYSVFIAKDAISSRTPENYAVGWGRMMCAGAFPTSTESAIFELLQEAGTPDFKAMLPFLK